MNDGPLLWLIYLLTYSDTERVLHRRIRHFGVSMVWCKHAFQRRRSNFNGKSIRFKGYGANKLIVEFLNIGWGLWVLNKLWKATRNWYDGKTKRQHWKHTGYLLFSYCVFTHKLNIIRKNYIICYLYANANIYVICMQIFSAAILPNIIKIGQHLRKQSQKLKGWTFLRHSVILCSVLYAVAFCGVESPWVVTLSWQEI